MATLGSPRSYNSPFSNSFTYHFSSVVADNELIINEPLVSNIRWVGLRVAFEMGLISFRNAVRRFFHFDAVTENLVN